MRRKSIEQMASREVMKLPNLHRHVASWRVYPQLEKMHFSREAAKNAKAWEAIKTLFLRVLRAFACGKSAVETRT